MITVRYRPEIFRSYKEFKAFESQNPNVEYFNEIRSQVEELIKLRNPKISFSENEGLLEKYVSDYDKKNDIESHGCWVFYPWLNQAIHILAEDEFIEVRTNRNKYKITEEEQKRYAQKIVGVVGLSVGQSVAVTMAMERIIGEIRLADFDDLELSNYNRIRTNLTNLGLNKAISAAREIALIDPFIKVKVFTDGLTEQNMDSFFSEGGNLDLLVEESDGLDIKITSRLKARELGIPVLMEASDRCVVDVERFDLEPNRPLLHGILGDMSLDGLKELKTNEQKMSKMIDIVGMRTLSLRMKASLLEVSNTITTWPQLASAVTMGGGVSTDVIRRIFNNEFTDSGRYYVDVAEIISNKDKGAPLYEGVYKRDKGEHLSDQELLSIANNCEHSENTNPIPMDVLKDIVHAAHWAPSGGNCQPWRWLYHKDRLYLFHDEAYSKSYLDFNASASEIALGAAAENLVLCANNLGYESKYVLYPIENNKELVAVFNFGLELKDQNHLVRNHNLADFISLRETNRNLYPSESIEERYYEEIERSLDSIDGAKIKFFKDLDTRRRIGSLLGRVERVRAMNIESHLDFANEVRWTEEENQRTRDGVDIATVDISEAHKAAYQLAMEPEVMDLMRKWDAGSGFAELNKVYAELSDSFALITLPKDTKNLYFHGGRALERAWLMLNGIGLNMQPQAVSVFLFHRLKTEGSHSYGQFAQHMEDLHQEFEDLFQISSDDSEIFIFRIFKGEKARVKSLRRDINEHFLISSGSY